MVACATNRNNAKNKRMKAIDKDVVSAPNNPKSGATAKGWHHIIWRNFGNGIRRADIQEGNSRELVILWT